MIRLTNDSLSRIIHYPLYQRLLSFCGKHCPEIPGDVTVNNWMSRLYANDQNLHILVNLELDTYTITHHAVIDIMDVSGYRIVTCHQTQHDTPNLSSLDEGMEYIEKLAVTINAHSILFFTTEHSKAFQKRYGYTSARTLMVKQV
jgi:hypothetical protein